MSAHPRHVRESHVLKLVQNNKKNIFQTVESFGAQLMDSARTEDPVTKQPVRVHTRWKTCSCEIAQRLFEKKGLEKSCDFTVLHLFQYVNSLLQQCKRLCGPSIYSGARGGLHHPPLNGICVSEQKCAAVTKPERQEFHLFFSQVFFFRNLAQRNNTCTREQAEALFDGNEKQIQNSNFEPARTSFVSVLHGKMTSCFLTNRKGQEGSELKPLQLPICFMSTEGKIALPYSFFGKKQKSQEKGWHACRGCLVASGRPMRRCAVWCRQEIMPQKCKFQLVH